MGEKKGVVRGKEWSIKWGCNNDGKIDGNVWSCVAVDCGDINV